MSIIYLGNTSPQRVVLSYRLNHDGAGVASLEAAPGSVGQTPELPTALCDQVVALWQQYGFSPWSGTGVGWSVDEPITLP